MKAERIRHQKTCVTGTAGGEVLGAGGRKIVPDGDPEGGAEPETAPARPSRPAFPLRLLDAH